MHFLHLLGALGCITIVIMIYLLCMSKCNLSCESRKVVTDILCKIEFSIDFKNTGKESEIKVILFL